jgi:dTDP-4-amino-4,6-dideoxygalactose transaminase
MLTLIPFNKPYFSSHETHYSKQTVRSGKIFGNGLFAQRVHQFFEAQWDFCKVLLTISCTDVLEIAALLNIGPGDGVIMPLSTS